MNRQTAVENLPWLLNETLDDAERRELEEQLAANPELRDELVETLLAGKIYQTRPPAEALIDHVEGRETSGIPRAVLEKLLASDEELREELEMVRESRAALLERESAAPAAGQDPENVDLSGPNVAVGPWRAAQRWRAAALAASLATMVLGAGWITSHLGGNAAELELRERVAQLESQVGEVGAAPAATGANQLGTRYLDEVYGVARGFERHEVSRSDRATVLLPELPVGVEGYERLRYVFRDASGAELAAFEQATPTTEDYYAIPVPTAELPLGPIDVAVLGLQAGDSGATEVTVYPLQIVP